MKFIAQKGNRLSEQLVGIAQETSSGDREGGKEKEVI